MSRSPALEPALAPAPSLRHAPSLISSTCDQCRLRKIKCGGGSPCVRCRKARLDCSRNYAHQRRGPKSGNGCIIRRLRTDQTIAQATQARNSIDHLSDQLTNDQQHQPGGKFHRSANGITPVQPANRDAIVVPDSASSPSLSGSVVTTSRDAAEMAVNTLSPVSSDHHAIDTARQTYQLLPFPRATSVPDAFPSPEPTFPSRDWWPSWRSSSQAFPPPASVLSFSTFDNQPRTPAIPTSYPAFDEAGSSGQRPLRLKSHHLVFDEPAIVALAERTGLPALLFSQCIKQFFRHLHASYPVLQESSLLLSLQEPRVSRERECLLLSLCAFTILRAPPALCIDGSSPSGLAKRMISCCQSARSSFDWIEEASLMTVIASYFLCMTYYDLEQKRSYEHYLREAIQLACADDLRLDLGGETETNDISKVLHGRILVLLYITNRSGGVQRHKAILQMARTSIPSLALDPGDDTKLKGLQLLNDMFDFISEDFIDTWVSSSCEPATLESQRSQLLSKKRSIDQLSFDVSGLTETQQPDLLVTLRWLRLAYWQLTLKKGLVSSTATDETLSYRYPMKIAEGLCEILRSLPVETVFRHGRCILEKIFDITYALVDCLAIANIPHDESPALIYLRSYLSCAPQIHHGFSGVLQKHIEGYAAVGHAI